MTRTKDMPVDSFGPNLQAVLRKGANVEVKINFPTPELALRFRHRIHTLRAAMKRENHPDWQQLYRCGIYIDPKDTKALIIAPRDSEFNEALKDAGFTDIEATQKVEYTIPEPKIPRPDNPADDPAESFLATLRDASDKDA
jgi:hypothetical protein